MVMCSRCHYAPTMDHRPGVEPGSRCFAGICLADRPAMVVQYGADDGNRTRSLRVAPSCATFTATPAWCARQGSNLHISCFVDRRLIRWATRARVVKERLVRAAGIGPASRGWEPRMLPLHHASIWRPRQDSNPAREFWRLARCLSSRPSWGERPESNRLPAGSQPAPEPFGFAHHYTRHVGASPRT